VNTSQRQNNNVRGVQNQQETVEGENEGNFDVQEESPKTQKA